MENTPMFKQCCYYVDTDQNTDIERQIHQNIEDNYDDSMIALFKDNINKEHKLLSIKVNQDVTSLGFVNDFGIERLKLIKCYNVEFKYTPSNITLLSIAFSNLQNVAGIQKMQQLQILDMNQNNIQNIRPIGQLTNLTHLNLNANRLKDISPLKHLVNLTQLKLEANQIIDIGALKYLTLLDYLFLQENQIVDVSPLKDLTNLRGLDLYHNYIQKFKPVYHHQNVLSYQIDGQVQPSYSLLLLARKLQQIEVQQENLETLVYRRHKLMNKHQRFNGKVFKFCNQMQIAFALFSQKLVQSFQTLEQNGDNQ
ncbi:leucine-rich_repeat domain-containing protein [Hexamita inflata]|uniref:Leucine-rich repeat domain-containing protein n=2 Tax=Hexamita inflata TaxID=28002 RepID=A0AA86NMW6_9EUKA|nr:leucine-rich repeat domain-containing protein [Hexamita inflata]CAI9924056.1 leucine-rich repeat domain-containing protein [Hexamita inflata]CAI9953016.1 leucine-rich repeat domain-containing protein [Hexamita inflata]